VARAARHPRRSAIPGFVITDLATEAMTTTQMTTHGLLALNKRLEAQQIKRLVPQAIDVSSRPSPPRTTNRPARRAPGEGRCRATMKGQSPAGDSTGGSLLPRTISERVGLRVVGSRFVKLRERLATADRDER
jgi:hypothetical protein